MRQHDKPRTSCAALGTIMRYTFIAVGIIGVFVTSCAGPSKKQPHSLDKYYSREWHLFDTWHVIEGPEPWSSAWIIGNESSQDITWTLVFEHNSEIDFAKFYIHDNSEIEITLFQLVELLKRIKYDGVHKREEFNEVHKRFGIR